MRFLLAIAVSTLPFLSLSTASAKPTAKANAKKAGKAATSTQILRELEVVRTQLNKANHDYKGHRMAAVHQITHAIHLLQHGKNHPNPGQNFTAGKGNRESQKQSDAQLRQAIQELEHIAGQLHNSQVQHHAAAATAVKKAIHDLHLALKVA